MEIALVLLVVAATVALFVSDKFPSSLVAMTVLALLLLVSRAGLPLNILFLALSVWLIPKFWPL